VTNAANIVDELLEAAPRRRRPAPAPQPPAEPDAEAEALRLLGGLPPRINRSETYDTKPKFFARLAELQIDPAQVVRAVNLVQNSAYIKYLRDGGGIVTYYKLEDTHESLAVWLPPERVHRPNLSLRDLDALYYGEEEGEV